MATKEPQWWKKKRFLIILGFIVLVTLILIILVIVNYGTGFEGYINTTVSKATTGTNPATVTTISQHQPGKTLWDWMQLLIIPVILAVGAFVFNLAQTRTEQTIAAERYKNDQEIATNKQREDLLQIYLDRMAELLLDKNLRSSQSDAEVRNVARARTLTVLPQLDAQRKGSLIQFLSESKLVEIISLRHADLTAANLRHADLGRANLSGADLSGADLSDANLGHAFLSNAKLRNAYLNAAYLNDTILHGTDLSGANLRDANLCNADLRGADLRGANFHDAKLRDANLAAADLRGAIIKQEQIDTAKTKPDDLT